MATRSFAVSKKRGRHAWRMYRYHERGITYGFQIERMTIAPGGNITFDTIKPAGRQYLTEAEARAVMDADIRAHGYTPESAGDTP